MSCCAPSGPDGASERIPAAVPGGRASHAHLHSVAQVSIPAGEFTMGDAHADGYRSDGETPVHRVRLPGFDIDATTVTVAAFAEFVDATQYRTAAELYGASAVFWASAGAAGGTPIPQSPWWLTVTGATWRTPGGPGTVAAHDHPVVHVSYDDALAYCSWAGRSLPTEAQWECAARGGLPAARYPWGDEHPSPTPGGVVRCNIFHGTFPESPDGVVGTVPAQSYQPNGFGLYQCVGNVWEWCADSFSARYYRGSPRDSPTGPGRGTARVLRGGSYLCHDSYCYRYRVSARSHNTPTSTAGNIGFRTVRVARPLKRGL